MSWMRKLGRALSGEAQDRDDLIVLMREALERDVIDADALQMLEGVLGVADLQVRDIMIPRAQMVAVRRDDSIEKLLPTIIESGHSRYPVTDDDRDDVVGILLAKDVLRIFAAGQQDEFDIREFMRPVVVVPESKRVNVLLREFRRSRNHMAIVVDEYGGVAGSSPSRMRLSRSSARSTMNSTSTRITTFAGKPIGNSSFEERLLLKNSTSTSVPSCPTRSSTPSPGWR
jgi:magnesium and cobalt transporter